jgi:hypothetical protein
VNRLRIAVSAALALVLCAGCTPDPATTTQPSGTPEPQGQRYPNWPAKLNDFRFQWTADPNIDLTGGPAVPIRAYLESYYVASFTASPNTVYPGFMRATPENDDLDGHYLAQLAWIRPLNGVAAKPEDAPEHFGYMPFHLLRIDRVGDGLRAIVCQGQYANFIRSTAQPGKYVAAAASPKTAQLPRDATGVAVYRLELTQHDPRIGSDPPPPVPAPQQGPAPAPDQDVFGNWFFTGVSSSFWGPIDAPAREEFPPPDLVRQCSDRMPLSASERVAMMSGFKDRPPPPGQATPGWPAKAQ